MSSKMYLEEAIVSVKWLYDNLEYENLVVLDGTINKVFDASSIQIPTARFFDIKKKFSDVTNQFPSAFPSLEQFQREARALGINTDSTIVVYDDKGIYSSARVWWLFKSFGFNNIAVLDGGFPAWLQAKYPTEQMSIYNGKEGGFIATYESDKMKFFKDMKLASDKKTHYIIDARSKGRFSCEVPEPREGLRMGTIPNSLNMPYTDLLDNGKLKSKQELMEAFLKVTNKEDEIIFSCGSGITACVLALGANIAGYDNISVYDGSWTEWGSLVK